ncbi:unnamed protein product [Schistosoma turkestanicum]|nr:unnamed protein product [Schistosoma turkestanicum]
MKMYIKCNVHLCIGLFFCTYLVNGIACNEFVEIHDLPKFIMEPIDRIYYSPSQLSISQFIPKFHLYALIAPRNATIQLGAVHKDKPNLIIYLPTIQEYSTEAYSMRFAQIYAKIQSISLHDNFAQLNDFISFSNNNVHSSISSISSSSSNNNNNNNILINNKENINLWSIVVYNFLPDMKLLILATTKYGTISSHLIEMKTSVLPEFPPHSDKYLSLLIGNTAMVTCHLPLSQPSLPTVYFYHNNIKLDLTQSDRYSLIYIGGDDSGLPWETRSYKPHFKQEYDKTPKPSAVVLLIHSLQLSDTGQYYCSVSLFDKTVSSNQRTHLVVTKPNEKIRTHLRFSSDDSDLSYLYNTNNDETQFNAVVKTTHRNDNTSNTMKEIKIYENTNLTLFCIFESAPVVSTRWYYEGFMDNIEINQKFGVLIIKYARMENAGIYTCSVDNSHAKLIGKSFRIVVLRSQSSTSSLNPKVIITEIGQQVILNCNNKSQTNNVINEQPIPFPKLPTRDEWQKWDFNERINQSKYHNANRYDKRKPNYSPYRRNKWIHNGQFVKINQAENHYDFEDGSLKITKITKSDTGIYQYMQINDYTNGINANSNENEYGGESVSCKFYIQLNNEKFVHNETGEQLKTILEYTSEGLTGHLNCNLSSLLLTETDQNTSHVYNQYQWSILWYRSVSSNEPLNIESINKASGGIKYIISNVNEYTQILSIVNPKKISDDGQYICRVYNTTTGKLLGEQRFQLIIGESNNGDDTHKNLLKHESFEPKTLSSAISSVNQNQNELSVETKEKELYLKQTIPVEKPQIKVSRPIVKRLANFTMALHIKWIVYNSPMKELHYQLGIKYLGRSRQTRSPMILFPNEYNANVKNQSNVDEEEEFSVLPNIYENSSIILDLHDVFQPQNSYSLRVLVLEHQLWSPWTEPVNFDNMLDTTLQIISLVVNNITCLYVEWIYIQPKNNSFTIDINNMKEMKFTIIYRNLSGNPNERKSLLELWTEFSRLNDAKQFPIDLSTTSKKEFGDLHFQQIIGDSSLKGYLLDGLQPNTTYAVSVYIEVTRVYHGQHQKYFTRLSNEAVQKTLSHIIPLSNNNENSFTMENATEESTNTIESSSIYSHIDSDSTVNELSQFQLDRFNSTLSPTTLSDYAGINRTMLNSLQNNSNNNINVNNRKEILRDYSQPTSLAYAASSIYPFITKLDNPVSIPLIGGYQEPIQHSIQSGLIPNDVNSFYTTVPPFRHLQYPFNGSLSMNPSDYSILNQLNNMSVNQLNHKKFIQQLDFIKNLQLFDKQSIFPGSNPLGYFSTPFSTYTDNLTATLTLQQWTELMSKPETIEQSNAKLAKDPYKKFDSKTNLKQYDVQLNKTEQQNLCYENNRQHKSPRENLSSSFADSGVDLPNTSNLEADSLEHNSNKNDSSEEIHTRRMSLIRPIERVSSGP